MKINQPSWIRKFAIPIAEHMHEVCSFSMFSTAHLLYTIYDNYLNSDGKLLIKHSTHTAKMPAIWFSSPASIQGDLPGDRDCPSRESWLMLPEDISSLPRENKIVGGNAKYRKAQEAQFVWVLVPAAWKQSRRKACQEGACARWGRQRYQAAEWPRVLRGCSWESWEPRRTAWGSSFPNTAWGH